MTDADGSPTLRLDAVMPSLLEARLLFALPLLLVLALTLGPAGPASGCPVCCGGRAESTGPRDSRPGRMREVGDDVAEDTCATFPLRCDADAVGDGGTAPYCARAGAAAGADTTDAAVWDVVEPEPAEAGDAGGSADAATAVFNGRGLGASGSDAGGRGVVLVGVAAAAAGDIGSAGAVENAMIGRPAHRCMT